MNALTQQYKEQHCCDDPWACCLDEDLLDRLILEVRAEMPCYDGDEFYWSVDIKAYTVNPCPSCSARAELVKVEVTA